MSELQESKDARPAGATGGRVGSSSPLGTAATTPENVSEALAEELEVEHEAELEAEELAQSFVDDGNEANVLETHAVHTPKPRRKRWKLPFSESPRGLVGLVVGPLLALIVWMTPIADLSTSAHGLLAMMCLVCTWWICEPVPIPVTSLLVPVLAVLTGLCSASEAFAPFSNPMIYLFLGGFVLAKAMMLHGLDKRFAYWLLSRKWVGSSPTRIFLAIGAATALCSGWVSNTATAAMMVPLSVGLLDAIRQMFARAGREVDMKTYKYATGLMLMTAYAASIGGVLTPIGTPPNLIMMGFLGTMANVHISFFQWMTWGAIAMVVYFIITAVLLQRMFPADVKEISGAQEFIAEHRRQMGGWTLGQICTLVVFLLAVVLWVMPGILGVAFGTDSDILAAYNKVLPESIVALLAAILLFFLPAHSRRESVEGVDEQHSRVISWKEAVDGIEWGTLLLFGGGLSMGSMMYSTGLSAWIGDCIVHALGGAPSQVVLIGTFCVLALFLSEISSHTAATNMVGPLAITTAIAAGFDPVPVAVGVALSASLGFMLPVSTPPNAIVYASGYTPITTMIRAGSIIDVIGIFLVTIPLVIFVVSAVV